MDGFDFRRRLALSSAEADFARGALARREFIRLCARAGFAFGLGSRGAAPRGAPAAPSATQIRATVGRVSAIDPLSDQQRFLRDVGRTFAGTTLHVLTEDTRPSAAPRALMKHEFTPLTGIDVEWEQLPLDRVLAKVIHQHHERPDGSGCPRSLKDSEIILEARILAVADVVVRWPPIVPIVPRSESSGPWTRFAAAPGGCTTRTSSRPACSCSKPGDMNGRRAPTDSRSRDDPSASAGGRCATSSFLRRSARMSSS